MPLPNPGEPEINPRSHLLCDPNTAVPIKKRRFMLETFSSSPPHSDCSSPVTCDVSRKSLVLESPVSDSCNSPASGAAITGNGSCEPTSELIGSRELNVTPASEGYCLPDHEERHPNMASKETSNRKELAPDKMLALSPVTGNFQLRSAKEPLELPIKDANMEDKALLGDASSFPVISGNSEQQLALKNHCPVLKDSINSGGCYLKHEKLDSRSWNLPLTETRENLHSKCTIAEPEADSAQLDRLNWDLNTTMDTWKESFGSALHDEISGRSSSDVVVGFAPAEFRRKEAVGSGTTSSKCVLEENNHLQMPSDSSKSTNEESHSEAYLDLQLKPSLMAESLFQWGYTTPLAKPNSTSELPLLSLAVNPSSASCTLISSLCGSVKSEPHVDCGKKDSGQTDVDNPRLGGLKQVKSEPCEGQEASNIGGSSNLKSACGAVKLEPSEDQDGGLSRPNGTFSSTPNTTKTTLGDGVLFEKTVQSLVRNHSMQQNCLNVPNVVAPCETLVEAPLLVSNDPNAHTTDNHDLKPHTTDCQEPKLHTSDNQDSKTHSTETDYCAQLPVGTKIPQHGSLNSLDIVQQEVVPEDESLRLFEQSCRTASLSSESLSECLLPGVEEEMVLDVNSNVAHMFNGDGYTLSQVTSAEEAQPDSFEKTKVAESSAGEFELSADGPDKSCKRDEVSNNDCNTDVTVVTVQKQRDEDEIEDGEVRDLALRSRVEDSFAKKEDNQVKVVDSFCLVNGHLELPPQKDLADGKMGSSDGLDISGAVNCNDNQYNDKNDLRIPNELNSPEPSVDANLNTGSDKKKLGKIIRKMPRNRLNDKALERSLKSDRLGARTITEEIHDKVCNMQEISGGSNPLLAKFSVSSKTELFIRESARKRAKEKGGHSRIVNLNSVTDRLTSDTVKSNPGRTVSLRTKKERLLEKPLRCEKSHPRRIRDEKNKYRSRIFERERSKDQTAGRRGSDSLHIRNRDNDNIKVLHDDRDFGREHAMEQVDCSTGSRFPRAINTSEVARSITSCRLTRKLVDNELDNLSHTPCRRRSPREGVQISVGMQMGRQPNRVISPPNYRGRNVQDVPDFVVRDREDRLLRTLPDGRIAPPLFAYTRYARGEGSLVHRERSLSPIQRRAPLHFPPICSGSSPRDEARPLHQWSPARRSPDGFDGSRELNCRSPRAIRPNRLRSPPRRPCFADDMVGRRTGSPPFATDMGPSRDSDFQRPDRGLQRSIRRFDRENSGEYFGSFPRDQFGEPGGDVECVDRSCSERRERLVLSRSFRQRRNVTDDDNESFRSHLDCGSAGPFRFCTEGNQGFPERGSPRDFDGHIRNRLGNRLRGVEQEEDYRYNGDPGWQDAGNSDARLKRRRLQRQ